MKRNQIAVFVTQAALLAAFLLSALLQAFIEKPDTVRVTFRDKNKVRTLRLPREGLEEFVLRRRELERHRFRRSSREISPPVTDIDNVELQGVFHFSTHLYPDIETVEEQLRHFPELERVQISCRNVRLPDSLLEAITDLPHLKNLFFGGTASHPSKDGLLISHEGLRMIADHPTVESLELNACRIPDRSFRQLGRMKSLRHLDIQGMRTTTFFQTVAQMRSIRSLFHCGYTLSEPADAETLRAIESLDGRLTSFQTEEYASIHGSVLAGLSRVRSLKDLMVDVGDSRCLTVDDFRALQKRELRQVGIGATTAHLEAQQQVVVESILQDVHRKAWLRNNTSVFE